MKGAEGMFIPLRAFGSQNNFIIKEYIKLMNLRGQISGSVINGTIMSIKGNTIANASIRTL